MRPINVFIFFLFGLLVSCDNERSVPPIYESFFTKYYGEDGNQTGVDMLVNSDGSMVLLGNSQSQTNPINIPFLVKINSEGNVLWQRRFGASNQAAVDVELDNQGNLIVVANVGPQNDSRIRLFKIDQGGNVLDSIQIQSNVWHVGTSVTQVSDGSFLVTGYASPTLVTFSENFPGDKQDLVTYKIDQNFEIATAEVLQGGESVGKIAKVFQLKHSDAIRYLQFGDSDRPLIADDEFRQTFEIIRRNEFFDASGDRIISGDEDEVQSISTTIDTSTDLEERFLMVGTSTRPPSTSKIYISEYFINGDEPSHRFNASIDLGGRRMEGVSAASNYQDGFYILGNELLDNNTRDIHLIKLSSDGSHLGQLKFGSSEGDDTAGAVSVLPDRRVAVFGTIELETQKKMVLILISPQGQFSE